MQCKGSPIDVVKVPRSVNVKSVRFQYGLFEASHRTYGQLKQGLPVTLQECLLTHAAQHPQW